MQLTPRTYVPWRTLLLAAILALCGTAVASAKPYHSVASATDVDPVFASASLSRTVKHPAKMRVRFASTSAAGMDFSYSVTCTTKDNRFDYESGGATVVNGQVVKLPRIFARPRSCHVSASISYSDFQTPDPPPVTISETLEVKSAAVRSKIADRDCGDFHSRRQAQRFFRHHHPHADPFGLDADHDGRACETYDYG